MTVPASKISGTSTEMTPLVLTATEVTYFNTPPDFAQPISATLPVKTGNALPV